MFSKFSKIIPDFLQPNRLPSFYVTDEGRRRDISEDYKLQSGVIGQPGQFGKAHICIRRRDRKACAVKVIDKTRFIKSGKMNTYYDIFKSEIDVMRKLTHPNIIDLYDVYENKKSLMLVMELCEGGELFDRIADYAKKGRAYNEKLAANVLKQILSALAFMHSHNICHCDLKPSNILFTTKNREAQVKVIDFGFAQRLPKWKRYLHHRCGTIYYLAPEVVAGSYNKQADLWSTGIIMFAMFFGYTPFQEKGDVQLSKQERDYAVMNRIQEGFKGLPKNRKISKQAGELIELLLVKDVQKRYNAQKALMHPWFESAGEDQEIPRSVLEELTQVSELDYFKIIVASAFGNDLDLTMTKQLTTYFELFDTNGDNRISLEEFQHGFEKFWPQLRIANIREMFANLDIDGNQYIQLDEFMALIAYQHLINAYDRLQDIFVKLDVNNNGHIEKAEIEKLAHVIDKDPLISRLQINPVEVFMAADLNNDGRVSFEEFLFAMHPELVEPRTRKNYGSEIAHKRRRLGQPLPKSEPVCRRMDSFHAAFTRMMIESKEENNSERSPMVNNTNTDRSSHGNKPARPKTSMNSISTKHDPIDMSKQDPKRGKKRQWWTCAANNNY